VHHRTGERVHADRRGRRRRVVALLREPAHVEDGATDLLITQNHGPAVLLKNEGGNKNNWLRLALKGLNSNKSAIGTKVEVFSDGIRQKYEIYGSNGYLGQNSPYLTVGLGQAKQADVVRMLWPGGVLQDEIDEAQVAALAVELGIARAFVQSGIRPAIISGASAGGIAAAAHAWSSDAVSCSDFLEVTKIQMIITPRERRTT